MARWPSAEERFRARIVGKPDTGCWIWSGTLGSDGYGQLRVDGRVTLAHRYSYEAARGAIPDGMCVCHTCDDPSCVNPAHLFLGTHAENMADMYRKGRGRKAAGEANGKAKLTRQVAAEIKSLLGKLPTASIAERYGVSQATVWNISAGRTWAATAAHAQ